MFVLFAAYVVSESLYMLHVVFSPDVSSITARQFSSNKHVLVQLLPVTILSGKSTLSRFP